MDVDFDPDVARSTAADLYRHATIALVLSTLKGLLIGSLVTGFIALLPSKTDGSGFRLLFASLPGAILGGGIGYVTGRRLALMARSQAQILLCQIEIEWNTRVGDDHRLKG